MFIDVYILVFRKLEIESVDNLNSANMLDTSYPHCVYKFILLKDNELSSQKCNYLHIHSTY